MGQMRSPAATKSASCLGWRRQRTRRWRRPNDLFGMSTMFAAIPSLPRAELAHLTQRMIDRLDDLDGDPDSEITEEDDEPEDDLDVAGDDGCGVILRGGKRRWGSEKDDPGDVIPIYGADQTRAPIGHRPAPNYRRKEDRHD